MQICTEVRCGLWVRKQQVGGKSNQSCRHDDAASCSYSVHVNVLDKLHFGSQGCQCGCALGFYSEPSVKPVNFTLSKIYKMIISIKELACRIGRKGRVMGYGCQACLFILAFCWLMRPRQSPSIQSFRCQGPGISQVVHLDGFILMKVSLLRLKLPPNPLFGRFAHN